MDLVCQGWFVLFRGSRLLSHFSFITQLLLQLACQPCRFFGWMYTLSISQYDNTTCKGIFFVVHIQDYQSGPCMPLVSAQSFWHHILVVHLSQVPLHWNQCWRIKLHTWVCIHRDFMHSCILVSPLPELGLEICLCSLLDASTGNKLLQHHACLYRLMSFVCFCVKSSWMYYSATWLLSLCFFLFCCKWYMLCYSLCFGLQMIVLLSSIDYVLCETVAERPNCSQQICARLLSAGLRQKARSHLLSILQWPHGSLAYLVEANALRFSSATCIRCMLVIPTRCSEVMSKSSVRDSALAWCLCGRSWQDYVIDKAEC